MRALILEIRVQIVKPWLKGLQGMFKPGGIAFEKQPRVDNGNRYRCRWAVVSAGNGRIIQVIGQMFDLNRGAQVAPKPLLVEGQRVINTRAATGDQRVATEIGFILVVKLGVLVLQFQVQIQVPGRKVVVAVNIGAR